LRSIGCETGIADDKLALGVDVVVNPIKCRRNSDQNAKYWVLISKLAEAVGMTKGQMHEEILCEAYGYDLVAFRGDVRKVPRERSSTQNKTSFSELIEIALQWCAEMGIDVAESKIQ
jgi:hypothetical protein